MTSLLVSIIVPAFNPGRYLDEALESILAQSYPAKEIIVVDDGSDPPCDTLSRFAPIVKFYRQSRCGSAHARNFGFSLSRGDFISFCDADDVCLPHKLEKQVSALQANPELGFVTSMISNFLEPGVVVPKWFKGEEVLESRPGFISSAMIRRSVFETVGPFDPEYQIGEDTEWLVRAKEMGVRSQTLSEVLVNRRVHNDNASANVKIEHSNLLKNLRDSLLRRRISPVNP